MKLVVCVLLLAVYASCSIDFYVSTTGNDTADGSSAYPFATLTRAQEAVRGLSRPLSASVGVHVAPGEYLVTEGLQFDESDSGSAYRPVVWSVWGTGEVLVSGGIRVQGWAKSSVVAGAYEAKLPAGTGYFRQFFVNGHRKTLARGDTASYRDCTDSTVKFWADQIPSTDPVNLGDVEIVLYEIWVAGVHQITSIDADTNTITLKNSFSCSYGSGSSGNKRFFFQNMFEALDTPGEFYFDRSTNILYYMPESAEYNLDLLDCRVPQPLSLLKATGDPLSGTYVEYVEFHNFTFQYAEVETDSCFASSCTDQSASFLTTAAIHLYGCRNWILSGLTIAHVGGYAMWLQKADFNNYITNCHMYDMGAGAFRAGPPQGGVESNKDLRVVNNTLSNSVLEYGGYYYQMGVGVFGQQVQDLYVQHNSIHDFAYTGVSLGWTWGYADTSVSGNIIEYNYIYNIGLGYLSDMACVYTLGHQPGTKIYNNICHEVESFDYGGWGLYTDEGSREIELRNNIVYNTKCAGFHQHYGTDNIIANNIFGDVDMLQQLSHCDSAVRSSQWTGTCDQSNPTGCCSSFSFITNVVYADSGSLLYETSDTGFVNMTLDYNCWWNDETKEDTRFLGMTFAEWQATGKDTHSLLADPQFVDHANNDYTLLPTSPAYSLGFVAIDTSTVGPIS
ncbi:Right handed beta helix region [Pelomyxa schiedti]|nr:Right handed beta helix region [Pelomyxa schiedti]